MRTAAWFFVLSLWLLAGCVVAPVPRYRVRQVKPAGISAEEVVRLTKAGLSDSVVLEKIKSEGVAARPSAEQVVSLKNDGVSEAVVGAMLTAPVVEERTVEVVYDYPYYSYPYYYPYSYYPYYSPYYYGYGYPYYGVGFSYSYYPYHYHQGYYPVHHATSVHTYRK
jgi:hypothetical protein